jgi:hypothetical protein
MTEVTLPGWPALPPELTLPTPPAAGVAPAADGTLPEAAPAAAAGVPPLPELDARSITQVKTQWDREDSRFMRVSPTCRLSEPRRISASTSPTAARAV